MARLRTIKPELWSSEQIVACSRDARLLFIGLLNFCDDAGVHPASLLRLKMQVFPADSCSQEEIADWIKELLESKLLIEYQASDGKRYWHVTGWHHQKIARPHYKYPAPNSNQCLVDEQSVIEQHSSTAQSLKDQCSIKHIYRNRDRNIDINNTKAAEAPLADIGEAPLQEQEVFAYWQKTLGHEQSKLDRKRRSKITQALKAYAISDLKLAIDGCKLSRFHQGDNSEGKVYDEIELILRDAKHIEQFIGFTRQPLGVTHVNTQILENFKGAI